MPYAYVALTLFVRVCFAPSQVHPAPLFATQIVVLYSKSTLSRSKHEGVGGNFF